MRRTNFDSMIIRIRLRDCFNLSYTAEQAAKHVGCSRATAQKYYNHLLGKDFETLYMSDKYNKKTPIEPFTLQN